MAILDQQEETLLTPQFHYQTLEYSCSPYQSALLPFCFAGGDRADHLLGPAGHLLTPAPAYVRLLQDLPGVSRSPPTN